MKAIQFCFFLYFLIFSSSNWAQSTFQFNIYHDSDYSNHFASANAIKMGFLSALESEKKRLENFQFNFLEMDHRGNSNRSLLHMKKFLKDPNALFILGGLHSPPYIKNRTFINKEQILLLVPWAAGGPITRYEHGTNWVFRLSVDDTKAGYRIIQFAKESRSCEQPHLLLEKTPWGKSNERTMQDALGKNKAEITWFNWNTRLKKSKLILRGIINSGADCIVFVGNAIEGKYFVQAMAEIDKSLQKPIISHWGITGGNFFNNTKEYLSEGIDLNFIQSCFSFDDLPHSETVKKAIKSAKALFKEEFDIESLQAPAGFVHGYDLGLLFVQALSQIKPNKSAIKTRENLRRAFENLSLPVEGLVKVYTRPFSAEGADGHEALGLEDLCMAEYKANGSISIIKNKG
ncbi:ABC transporter substrate-binding protein [Pseudoalteromonas phenolica]|uniref:HAAT family amino acid/amide ABC transporter substrate-binding protein n=1 Tax=Pseudoalteromonas phenolica TaxID=161398 RepID=A0A0S2K206_9GAMM|nr:ABC transporter substrate-binding protein [Pseudoalteromonas phenolica]ALO42002.1 HAAT family amino acid/amide ABC transporter substrate-binding protein [Pseudoalteromonas phenolica]MBE0353436.1 branched-chain amino acid transport system substrate-binding protein [Pseudoalteromonas phenolica O-BC30]